jgi:hypothetical protein
LDGSQTRSFFPASPLPPACFLANHIYQCSREMSESSTLQHSNIIDYRFEREFLWAVIVINGLIVGCGIESMKREQSEGLSKDYLGLFFLNRRSILYSL